MPVTASSGGSKPSGARREVSDRRRVRRPRARMRSARSCSRTVRPTVPITDCGHEAEAERAVGTDRRRPHAGRCHSCRRSRWRRRVHSVMPTRLPGVKLPAGHGHVLAVEEARARRDGERRQAAAAASSGRSCSGALTESPDPLVPTCSTHGADCTAQSIDNPGPKSSTRSTPTVVWKCPAPSTVSWTSTPQARRDRTAFGIEGPALAHERRPRARSRRR